MEVVPEKVQGHRRARWRPWILWVLLGLAIFLLALLLPPSGDDWRRIDFADHTLSGYLDRSRRFYLEHNGRVLPNLLSFLLMDPLWLRALAKALTLVGLVVALQRVGFDVEVVEGDVLIEAIVCLEGNADGTESYVREKWFAFSPAFTVLTDTGLWVPGTRAQFSPSTKSSSALPRRSSSSRICLRS